MHRDLNDAQQLVVAILFVIRLHIDSVDVCAQAWASLESLFLHGAQRVCGGVSEGGWVWVWVGVGVGGCCLVVQAPAQCKYSPSCSVCMYISHSRMHAHARAHTHTLSYTYSRTNASL